MENEDSIEKKVIDSTAAEKVELNTINLQAENHNELLDKIESLDIDSEDPKLIHEEVKGESGDNEIQKVGSENQGEMSRSMEKAYEEEQEPVFDGTEIPGVEATRTSSTGSLDPDPEAQGSAWPEKAVALGKIVKEKSVVAVSNVFRRLSGSKDEETQNVPDGEGKDDDSNDSSKEEEDKKTGNESKEASKNPLERFGWNPLAMIKRDLSMQGNVEQGEDNSVESPVPPPSMKGRILLYTRLGCMESKDVRLYLQAKNLRYVEINIDVYPSRKLELEKLTGSSAVPKVFFNEVSVGGLAELKAMDEDGSLDEKIKELISEEPSSEAPLPPLSGEDDVSCSGTVDEQATIIKKMKETISVKDRFYKMRRFTNCFLGSEAVDFLSEDQYMERKEAIEFGQQLAKKYFFRHVLDENVFEDGNHLYRFLDHDPIVSSQCYNITKGISDVKPKPVIEIASRLRFLSFAMFEAYTSEDGKHVDYRSIHRSEEFARYLSVVEELQRVELQDLSREEKLAFFINLHNMMAIHAILLWGYPIGAMERRKMLGDFKYVVGGYTYSLSAIQNGILRCNQRPPYNITKPFGGKDPRSKVALPYLEPLIHFTLVCGTRSGPALRCYSPGNIDKELMEAARNFLRNGGLIFDPATKTAYVTIILKWFSVDFGKNEGEVVKHAANYLEPEKSEELLELVANNQLKVTYQPYDWGLNC
ncbi:hypothetical protein MKW98_026109 [Papaver atlanticum]|uniref:DEP domain-containing protein n=1 Tax=Papaver atlanticum TaxID=357466 RepID=A0AAD4RYG6_9MAGN|nr:hypothetical protein MKW98_026109 [Papaver atlanticum]